MVPPNSQAYDGIAYPWGRSMTKRTTRLQHFALSAIAAAAMPALAAPFKPIGRDILLGFANGAPSALAIDAAGNSVVAWREDNESGSGNEIVARLVDASGHRARETFRINQFSAGDQKLPAVAMSAVGNFVVAWQSADQDGSGTGIFARRYNAAGLPQGDEFQVNVFASNNQSDPAVAMDADGDFVVVWVSADQDGGFASDIIGRRFSSSGLPLSDEIRISAPGTTGSRGQPAVAMDAQGGFAVVWADSGALGDEDEIFGRLFTADGTPRAEFVANNVLADNQRSPDVAMDPAGDLVVTWVDQNASGGYGVFARRFDARAGRDLFSRGNQFLVSQSTTTSQDQPAVAMNVAGNFAVVWEAGLSLPKTVMARRFRADGTAEGDDFALSSSQTAQDEFGLDVAMDADGDLVTSWDAYDQRSYGDIVLMRRFRGGEAIDLATSIRDNRNANRPAFPGFEVTYTATVENLHVQTPVTGVADIDLAIGAALGTELIVSLPQSGASLSQRVRLVSGPPTRCRALTNAARCTLSRPLRPGEVARFKFKLLPVEPGVLSPAVTAITQSFDPDRNNDADFESTQVREP